MVTDLHTFRPVTVWVAYFTQKAPDGALLAVQRYRLKAESHQTATDIAARALSRLGAGWTLKIGAGDVRDHQPWLSDVLNTVDLDTNSRM